VKEKETDRKNIVIREEIKNKGRKNDRTKI
jgi:hypothetical protein